MVVHFATLRKTSARRRSATVLFIMRWLYNGSALREWIALHSARTTAHRNVVVDGTNGVWRTSAAIARVHAFASQTRLISGTIAVQNALWSTQSVRIALQARQTGANSVVALRIVCTRRRVAFIFGDFIMYRWSTLNKSIPFHSARTSAHRNMVRDAALGLDATRTGTRIDAMVSNTGFVALTIRIEDAFLAAVRRRAVVMRGQAGARWIIADGVAS